MMPKALPKSQVLLWIKLLGLLSFFLIQTSALHAEPPVQVRHEIQRILFGEENSPPLNKFVFSAAEADRKAQISLSNDLHVYFNPDPYSEKPNVECRSGDSVVSFRTLSEIRLSRTDGKEEIVRSNTLKKHHSNEPGYVSNPQGDRFVYPCLFTDPKEGSVYSAEYFINSQGTFLEEIILDRPQEVLSISQEIVLKNADIREGEAGSFNLYRRGTDALLFSIPAPKMYEKNNPLNENTGLHYELKSLGKDRYLLTKVLDEKGRQWLLDPTRTYPVVIDASISYGSEAIFNSAATAFVSTAALDSTHFVAVYSDGGNSDKGTAIVGSVSGSTISYGAESVFNSATTVNTKVASLDATHFVVSYTDVGNSSYGTARVGVVSGTTISSYGAENVFNSAETTSYAIAKLDSTHFVVIYQDGGNSYYGTARVGVVSGTTISSYGAESVYYSGVSPRSTDVTALDATHFVVVYEDESATQGAAKVGLVSGGTTISSYGAEAIYNSAESGYSLVTNLDSTHFVVVYLNGANSYYPTTRVGTVSGTTVSSYGTATVVDSNFPGYSAIATLDSTNVIIQYSDGGNSYYGTVIVGAVSGSDITYGTEYVYNPGATGYMSFGVLDSSHFVTGYEDFANSSKGTAIVGTVATSGSRIIIVQSSE